MGFVPLAAFGEDFRDVEDAVRVRARVDALRREGLDVRHAAVLEGDCLVQGVELVVNVVDLGGIGKLDGEDANATGSCV